MKSLVLCMSLLAQMHQFEGLRNRFSGSRAQFGLADALTALAVLLGASTLLYFVNRWHQRHSGRRSYNSPKALFRELCRAHALNREERQLLKRMAHWQRLTQPARLFTEPERFETANLSPDLEQQLSKLHAIRSKLFSFEVPSETMKQTPAETNKQATLNTQHQPSGPA